MLPILHIQSQRSFWYCCRSAHGPHLANAVREKVAEKMTRSHKPHALVTDGLWRKSLSAIRSLGKSGFDVTVMGDSWFTRVLVSLYEEKASRALGSQCPNGSGISLLNFLEKNPGMILLPNGRPHFRVNFKIREALEKNEFAVSDPI